jgi:hypothetical protein
MPPGNLCRLIGDLSIRELSTIIEEISVGYYKTSNRVTAAIQVVEFLADRQRLVIEYADHQPPKITVMWRLPGSARGARWATLVELAPHSGISRRLPASRQVDP